MTLEENANREHVGDDGTSRRDLWLPVLVLALGLLASLTLWGLVVAERRIQIVESARETAADTRAAIEASLAIQLDVLTGLQDLWANFGLRGLDAWVLNVSHRVDRTPGLMWVAFVEESGEVDRIAVRQGLSERRALDDYAASRVVPRSGDRATIVGPFADSSGATTYRIQLPVDGPGHVAGALVAHVHVEPFLDFVLHARAPGYAMSIAWDGQSIYGRGEPSTDRWQKWWRVEEIVALPMVGSWSVVLRPTPVLAATRLTPLPHYLLGLGAILSVVLAVVAHQLRVIVRQSRFLAATNRALEQRKAELEQKVKQRTQDLEDALAEREAFNYSVSHDLRSPLSAILNYTAILVEDYADRPLDDEAMNIVARIKRSAGRATNLLEDLLQLSRAGRQAIDPEVIDMRQLAREVFAQVRAGAGDDAADVELLVDAMPDAVGDRSLLGDVFANLFSNALKYSRGKEKRRVTVTGRVAGNEHVYEVADNGNGFDMRFVDKLFGVFERLCDDEAVEGTGVGLAIVARIIKRHGGHVWAEGAVGEGARFSFALPGEGPE